MILEIPVGIHTVLYLSGLGCALDLWVGITLAFFHSVGKILVFSDKFIECANAVDISSVESLIRPGGR